MESEAIRNLLEELSQSLQMQAGNPRFTDNRYRPYPLSVKNMHPIPDSSEKRRICFIDGGNQPLMSSPSFAIHLVRVYFNLFEGEKRLESRKMPQRMDFYVLALSCMGEEEIMYKGIIYPVDNEHGKFLPDDEIIFSSQDASIRTGLHRADINRVCSSARRFVEWHIAGQIIENELSEGDVVVRDGTLQTSVTHEADYADEAYEKAHENNVFFTSLAKTSTLYTDTGNCLSKVISDLGSKVEYEKWYYHPLVDIKHPDHRAEMFFVKLHGESDYVFRFEINKDQYEEKEAERILGLLAKNSRDLSFPGYPYGLIDADRFARVGEFEKNQHWAMITSLAQKGLGRKIKQYLAAEDAHDRLNLL